MSAPPRSGTSSPSHRGTIPLWIEPDPDEPGCAQLSVDARVAGRPVRFILDTGAARTQVIGEPNTTVTARPQDSPSFGVFGPNERSATEIKDLVVGPIELARLEAGCVPPSASALNLLGMDVLGRWCWEFAFADGVLRRRESPSPEAERPLRMDDGGRAHMDVGWGGIRANACWDTGAGITVVDQRFAEAHPELFTAPSSSVGTDSGGRSVQTPTFAVAGPVIAEMQFAAHRVAVVDLAAPNAGAEFPMDLILGYPTLRQADWLMDFPARRWAARRHQP